MKAPKLERFLLKVSFFKYKRKENCKKTKLELRGSTDGDGPESLQSEAHSIHDAAMGLDVCLDHVSLLTGVSPYTRG